MFEALEHPFMQRALVAALLASVACGVVGAMVVVRQISSISGGLSHAAFGGVGLGVLLGFDPILGATAFALAAAFAIGFAYRRVQSGLETIVAMLWSVGMALGMLFLSLTPGYATDLGSYLFGSILYVNEQYLWIVGVLDLVVVGSAFLFFKELQATAFDEEFAELRGLSSEVFFHALLALSALAVVTLIRVVGVVLVIALLSIPAVVARQWSFDLRRMMVLATLICAACTTSGLFLAYELDARAAVSVPTGPLVVLLAALVFVTSSLLSWWRGRS